MKFKPFSTKVLRKKFKFDEPENIDEVWYRYRYEDSDSYWYGAKNNCTLWNDNFTPGKLKIRPCYSQTEYVEFTLTATPEDTGWSDDEEAEFVWDVPTEILVECLKQLGYTVSKVEW